MATFGAIWREMAPNGDKWHQMAKFGEVWHRMAPFGYLNIYRQMAPFGDENFAHGFFQTMPHRHMAIPPSIAKIWRMANVGDRQMAPFGDENGVIWR